MSTPIPAELREVAGKAAHGAHLASNADSHPISECRSRLGCCYRCDNLTAAWPDLTEVQREEFRAQGDPALSVVWPVLREVGEALANARAGLRQQCPFTVTIAPAHDASSCTSRWCEATRALARLAALGVRP